MSNQFELIINTKKVEDRNKQIIFMDFLHHNLDFLYTTIKKIFQKKLIEFESKEYVTMGKLSINDFILVHKKKNESIEDKYYSDENYQKIIYTN